MTGGDRGSRSWPTDADGSEDATAGETDGDDESDDDPGLLEQVADAIGNLWDDEPDEPGEA
jgi:hypothetical protein